MTDGGYHTRGKNLSTVRHPFDDASCSSRSSNDDLLEMMLQEAQRLANQIKSASSHHYSDVADEEEEKQPDLSFHFDEDDDEQQNGGIAHHDTALHAPQANSDRTIIALTDENDYINQQALAAVTSTQPVGEDESKLALDLTPILESEDGLHTEPNKRTPSTDEPFRLLDDRNTACSPSQLYHISKQQQQQETTEVDRSAVELAVRAAQEMELALQALGNVPTNEEDHNSAVGRSTPDRPVVKQQLPTTPRQDDSQSESSPLKTSFVLPPRHESDNVTVSSRPATIPGDQGRRKDMVTMSPASSPNRARDDVIRWERVEYTKENDDDYVPLVDYSKNRGAVLAPVATQSSSSFIIRNNQDKSSNPGARGLNQTGTSLRRKIFRKVERRIVALVLLVAVTVGLCFLALPGVLHGRRDGKLGMDELTKQVVDVVIQYSPDRENDESASECTFDCDGEYEDDQVMTGNRFTCEVKWFEPNEHDDICHPSEVYAEELSDRWNVKLVEGLVQKNGHEGTRVPPLGPLCLFPLSLLSPECPEPKLRRICIFPFSLLSPGCPELTLHGLQIKELASQGNVERLLESMMQ